MIVIVGSTPAALARRSVKRGEGGGEQGIGQKLAAGGQEFAQRAYPPCSRIEGRGGCASAARAVHLSRIGRRRAKRPSRCAWRDTSMRLTLVEREPHHREHRRRGPAPWRMRFGRVGGPRPPRRARPRLSADLSLPAAPPSPKPARCAESAGARCGSSSGRSATVSARRSRTRWARACCRSAPSTIPRCSSAPARSSVSRTDRRGGWCIGSNIPTGWSSPGRWAPGWRAPGADILAEADALGADAAAFHARLAAPVQSGGRARPRGRARLRQALRERPHRARQADALAGGLEPCAARSEHAGRLPLSADSAAQRATHRAGRRRADLGRDRQRGGAGACLRGGAKSVDVLVFARVATLNV